MRKTKSAILEAVSETARGAACRWRDGSGHAARIRSPMPPASRALGAQKNRKEYRVVAGLVLELDADHSEQR
jgi:hypothetical protein